MTDLNHVFGAVVTDAPTLSIAASDGHRLLALNIEDGRLIATYDEADLTEAAQIFVRELIKAHENPRAFWGDIRPVWPETSERLTRGGNRSSAQLRGFDDPIVDPNIKPC